jgi:hypothetical protein
MNSCDIWFTLLLGSSNAFLTAASPDSQPSSPFSWTIADTSAHVVFTPAEVHLGSSLRPSSAVLVDFRDARSYGDVSVEKAWLVRYDSLEVLAPERGSPAKITLFLACRHSTGELIAAFTESSPTWAKSGWTSEDITKRAAESWDFFPPESATLRSSVLDVLREVWKHSGASPTHGGQIAIRPRQFLRRVTIHDESGRPIPQLKTNGWLVEVLGRHIGMTRFGVPFSFHLEVFRDGDLAFSGGLRL